MKPERIIAAAIIVVPEGRGYVGKDHNEAIEKSGYPSYPPSHELIKGFLTSKDRFVRRSEAHDIAVAAGQIQEKVTGILLSQDLDLRDENIERTQNGKDVLY